MSLTVSKDDLTTNFRQLLHGKRLLILGAGVYQVPLIEQARNLGIWSITVDNQPSNPGHRLGNQSFQISTTDHERLLTLAEAERIDGVIAFATDVAVPAAARIGEKLKLTAPSVSAATITTSKVLFRQFCRFKGLRYPSFVSVSRGDLVPSVQCSCMAPWIVKPDRSSGSKGVRIVTCSDQLCYALEEAFTFSLNDRAIVERFIEGHQGTVEGFVLDEDVSFAVVSDRITAPFPFCGTVCHEVPSRLKEPMLGELMSEIKRVLRTLGMRSGPFDCDFVVDEHGRSLIIELGLRLGGNSIVKLVNNACSVNLYQAACLHALGLNPQLGEFHTVLPRCMWILGASRDGVIRSSLDDRVLSDLPETIECHLDYKCGDSVKQFRHGHHRLGEVLLAGDSPHEFGEIRKRVVRVLNVTIF